MRREPSKNAIAFVGFILLHALLVCQSFFMGQTALKTYNTVISKNTFFNFILLLFIVKYFYSLQI